MDIRVVPSGLEYDAVITNGDSSNIFEYVKNASKLAEEVGNDAEVVLVYYTSWVDVKTADIVGDDETRFAGFGVLTNDDWGDPVLL